MAEVARTAASTAAATFRVSGPAGWLCWSLVAAFEGGVPAFKVILFRGVGEPSKGKELVYS